MTLEEKKQEILRAANSAEIPFRRIDIKGGGNSVRRLLEGSQPTPQKLEEMYANLLAYRQFDLQQKTQQQLNLSPDPHLTFQQKKDLILEAHQKGIPQARLDPQGGKAVTRLKQGKNVSEQKLDDMYLNLLQVAGHRVENSSISDDCPSCNRLLQKASSLEHLISSLFDRISSLEVGVEKLQKELDQKKSLPSKTTKILGVSLVRKTDVIRGKKYPRWYGLHKHHGKRCWIYIGNDLSKAKSKIQAWFNSHQEGAKK